VRDAPALISGKVASWVDEVGGIRVTIGMQNSDSEEARNGAARDDEEATSSDGAAEEAVEDRDDEEALSRDGAEKTDVASDERGRGADGTAVAERDAEDPASDAEQATAVTGADRKEARKSVKKGDRVWTMYLPSTSGKEFAFSNNNYGCEHYKRKSKFVVSSRMLQHVLQFFNFIYLGN